MKLCKALLSILLVVVAAGGGISLLAGCEKKEKSPIEKLQDAGDEAKEAAEGAAEDM